MLIDSGKPRRNEIVGPQIHGAANSDKQHRPENAERSRDAMLHAEDKEVDVANEAVQLTNASPFKDTAEAMSVLSDQAELTNETALSSVQSSTQNRIAPNENDAETAGPQIDQALFSARLPILGASPSKSSEKPDHASFTEAQEDCEDKTSVHEDSPLQTSKFKPEEDDKDEANSAESDIVELSASGASEGSLEAQDITTVVQTPKAPRLELVDQPAPTPKLLHLDSPQIGTTLLRRESLRRRSSSRKSSSAKKSRSPNKKQLKKRDTLQEREILQRFSESVDTQGSNFQPPADENVQVKLPTHLADRTPASNGEDTAPILTEVEDTASVGEAVLETRDLQRAVEAIEVCEDTTAVTAVDHSTTNTAGHDAIIEANKAIANAEIVEAQQTITDICEKADLPVRRTRSGARFSDDTSLLKDFLSRAQASKAAKTTVLSPKVPKSLQQSPRRSPKKLRAIASPEKGQHGSSRHNSNKLTMSPNKAKLETTFGDDLDEEVVADPDNEQVACRRSTRMRLPAPPKTPPGVPSLIPVRRADRVDPVVLQKSQAQELAMVTRANTRKNKGPAKPPQLALRDIKVDDTELTVTSIGQGAGDGKTVAWAEHLAFYQESNEAAEDPEERRPRVRRIRGLGAGNGTPAAKEKIVGAAPANGTPGPKRRGKVRG